MGMLKRFGEWLAGCPDAPTCPRHPGYPPAGCGSCLAEAQATLTVLRPVVAQLQSAWQALSIAHMRPRNSQQHAAYEQLVAAMTALLAVELSPSPAPAPPKGEGFDPMRGPESRLWPGP